MTAAELNEIVDTATVAAAAAEAAADTAATEVAKAATPAKRTRRPAATVKTGNPAADRAAKDAATAKANAKVTPAKPAAKATAAKATAAKATKPAAAKVTAAELAKMAPTGYVVKWPHGAHSLLAKTDKAAADASPWLVLCHAHGTTTPAANAKAGEALGTADGRKSWCKACKTAK